MKKLLVICGPTATGKTRLAISLAKLIKGELISADSRQVYKMMDIGTGKDLPAYTKPKYSRLRGESGEHLVFYEVSGVKLWGYDLVEPTQEFSVAKYLKVVSKIIKDIRKRRKLPILVGGTGLYIRGVTDGIESAFIPRNENIRTTFLGKKPQELFEILAVLNPMKAAGLNRSDRENPRRLIRAIEIAKWSRKQESELKFAKPAPQDILFVGLTASVNFLEERIKNRVQERVSSGIENEIHHLLNSGVSWKMQSMNTLGYKEWLSYLVEGKSKELVIEEWTRDEKKYAKRQVTWFKKDKRIKWFDVSKQGWKVKVENLIRKWHNKNDNAKKN